MNIYVCADNSTPIEKKRQREIALYLLDYAIEREFGVKRETPLKSGKSGKSAENYEIIRGEHGKPYFKGSHIHFSYSHCKYGVVCGVNTEPLGVDIQEIRQVKPALLPALSEKFCCDNERKIIGGSEDFIQVWTRKEAYSKYTGNGLTEKFSLIDTTLFPDGLSVKYGNCYIACYTPSLVSIASTLQLVQVSPP